jgi:hypothetical protein
MALTLYTTQILDWHNGEFDTLSVHITERGAKRRLIDYIVSELNRIAEWDEGAAEKLAEFQDKHCYTWNENLLQVENFNVENTQDLYYDLQQYCGLFDSITLFEYNSHTLEG